MRETKLILFSSPLHRPELHSYCNCIATVIVTVRIIVECSSEVDVEDQILKLRIQDFWRNVTFASERKLYNFNMFKHAVVFPGDLMTDKYYKTIYCNLVMFLSH